MHATMAREKKAVEAMAVGEVMSAADKVLRDAGVLDTDAASKLLGGPSEDDGVVNAR